jgi:hypothetical protein
VKSSNAMIEPAGVNSVPARRSNAIALAVIGALTLAFFLSLVWLMSISEVTASAMSPDGRMRAEVVDRSFPRIDRNLRIRIVDDKGDAQVVFTSNDEPRSGIGQDRLLWSSDGQRLLLVGKKFWVREGVELTAGEFLYVLYDLPSGKVWCNSDHDGPPFGLEELEGFDFGEPLTLKP